MAKSQQSFSKKEKEKKKQEKRKEKAEKREQRKANSGKGKSFEDMIAYVDEFGNLTSTPPDLSKRTELKLEDIQLGARKESQSSEEPTINKGRVTYYSDTKGYGFIKHAVTKESIFFHLSSVNGSVHENDLVTFDMVRGPKGYSAVGVSKIAG